MKELRKDYLLIAVFISNMLFTVGYPTIQEVTMKAVNSQLISLNSLIGCLSVVVAGKVWDKIEDKMMKLFPLFAIGDIVTYTILVIAFWITKDAVMYYIVLMLIACLTIKNVGFGLSIIKSKRYNGKARAKFDNNEAVLGNIASVIGFGIGALVKIPIELGLAFMLMGTFIENIFYVKAYKEIK